MLCCDMICYLHTSERDIASLYVHSQSLTTRALLSTPNSAMKRRQTFVVNTAGKSSHLRAAPDFLAERRLVPPTGEGGETPAAA